MSNNCKLYNIKNKDDNSKNYYTFSSENNKKLYKNVGYDCANCHNNSFSELMEGAKLIHPYSSNEYNLNVTKYNENIYGITCYDESKAQHNCCGSSGDININYDNKTGTFVCDSDDLNRNFGRCGFISDLVSGNKCSLLPETKYKYTYGPVIDKKEECINILSGLAQGDPNSYKNTESSICKRHNIQLVKDLDIIYKPITHGITEMFIPIGPNKNIFGRNKNAVYSKISYEKIYGVGNSPYSCEGFSFYSSSAYTRPNKSCSEFTLFKPINLRGLKEKTKNLIILSTLIKLGNKTERMFLNCTVPTDGGKSELCLTTADEPLRLLYNFEALIKLDQAYKTRKFANGGNTPVFFSRYDHTNYIDSEQKIISGTLNKNVPFVTTNDLENDYKNNKAVSSLSTTYTTFTLEDDFVRYNNNLGSGKKEAKKNSKLVSLTTDTNNNFILVSSYTETPGGSGKVVLRDHHRNGNDGGGNEGQYFLANKINDKLISFEEYEMEENSYNNVTTTPTINLKFALNFIISEESNYSNMNKDYGFMPTKKFIDKGFLSLDSKVDNKTIFKYLTQDNTNPATVDPITIKDILNSFPFYQPDLCKYGLSNGATC